MGLLTPFLGQVFARATQAKAAPAPTVAATPVSTAGDNSAPARRKGLLGIMQEGLNPIGNMQAIGLSTASAMNPIGSTPALPNRQTFFNQLTPMIGRRGTGLL